MIIRGEELYIAKNNELDPFFVKRRDNNNVSDPGQSFSTKHSFAGIARQSHPMTLTPILEFLRDELYEG